MDIESAKLKETLDAVTSSRKRLRIVTIILGISITAAFVLFAVLLSDDTDSPSNTNGSSVISNPPTLADDPLAPQARLVQYENELQQVNCVPRSPSELQDYVDICRDNDSGFEFYFIAFKDGRQRSQDPWVLMAENERLRVADGNSTGRWSHPDGRHGTYVKFFQDIDNSRHVKIWLEEDGRSDVIIVTGVFAGDWASQSGQFWEKELDMLRSGKYRFNDE